MPMSEPMDTDEWLNELADGEEWWKDHNRDTVRQALETLIAAGIAPAQAQELLAGVVSAIRSEFGN